MLARPGGEALAGLPCLLHLEAHVPSSLVEFGPILVEVVEHLTVVKVGKRHHALVEVALPLFEGGGRGQRNFFLCFSVRRNFFFIYIIIIICYFCYRLHSIAIVCYTRSN